MTDINEKLSHFGMKLEFWPVPALVELANKTKNPKKHFNKDIEALSSSIGDLGFKGAVFINKDATEIGAGVGRIMAASRRPEISELPVFRILDLNKSKFKKFRIIDNRIPQLSAKWDEDILFQDLSELASLGEDLSYMEFDKYDKLLIKDATKDISEDLTALDASMDYSEDLGGMPVSSRQIRGDDDESEPLPVGGMVRAVQLDEGTPDDMFAVDFSSGNDWGIPDLVPKFQASYMVMPFVKWGEISYKKPMNGTWHFYVDDEKFARLPDDPMPPLRSMPENLVELNFSTFDTQPAALAIGQIFFKRWVARFWQSKGFNIIVDLNVVPKFSKLNLLGVPDGWKAYATRGSGEIGWVKRDWETACAHSGAPEEEILFIVYGGGKEVQALSKDHNWNWVPERMQIVSNPTLEGMDGLDVKVSTDKYSDL